MSVRLPNVFFLMAAALPAATVYDFTVRTATGEEQPLSAYRGRVLLIVNVASRCGFTPQYEALEALHRKYGDRGFTVLGFPSNDFAGQEPDSNDSIQTFCKRNYGVTFPVFAKVSVFGSGRIPLYDYLTDAKGGFIAWNFTKFIVGRDGRVRDRFAPWTKPGSSAVGRAIEEALAAR